MRILLDHCVPIGFAPHIRGHDVTTVRQMGWQQLDDGQLLDAAAAGMFDVLVTVDASIPYQQILGDRPIAVIVLSAGSNRVAHLARLIPKLHRALKKIAPGEMQEIS